MGFTASEEKVLEDWYQKIAPKPFTYDDEVRADLINKLIGYQGRMISGNKRGPKDHLCVFNGNICTQERKIWFGDIDITKDTKKLQKVADTFGEPIYILREHDARFENENSPLLDKAVAVFKPQEK